MRPDKNLAVQLRKSGESYNQISQALKVPKSTLSIWLKDIALSKEAREKIQARVNLTSLSKLIIRNKQQSENAQKNHEQIRQLAKMEARKLISNPLFLIGASLYWAEGYKRGATGSKWKSIDFANSDPEMIKLMVLFFTKFLDLKKSQIKIQIMLHDQKQSEEALKFWQNITGIPKENFIKICYAISKASLQKRNKNLQYGTIHLRIADVSRFFRLIGWIDYVKGKFI